MVHIKYILTGHRDLSACSLAHMQIFQSHEMNDFISTHQTAATAAHASVKSQSLFCHCSCYLLQHFSFSITWFSQYSPKVNMYHYISHTLHTPRTLFLHNYSYTSCQLVHVGSNFQQSFPLSTTAHNVKKVIAP